MRISEEITPTNNYIVSSSEMARNRNIRSVLAIIFILKYKGDDVMWVEKTKSGNYKFVERYKDYLTGKEKKVSVTLEKNNASARKQAAELLAGIIAERQTAPAAPEEITLRKLVNEYLAYKERTVKLSTYRRDYYQCQAFLAMLGEDTLVNNLTASYIKNRFVTSGEDNSRLNERRVRLMTLLNWGFENDYIRDVGWLRKFKPFPDDPHKVKIQDKYMEDYELDAVLNAMDHERWKLFTEFLVLSGLRIGEAVALDRKDVDFESQCIHVTKTFDGNNKIVTTPKSFCSIRDVYMQPELFQLCRKINIFIRKESIFLGYRSNLFFPNENGGCINYNSYNKYLKKVTPEVLGRKLTAHSLRHTHASLLLANGVTIDAISRRLGHENSRVTRRIYLHITKKLKERDNDQIRDLKII